jgi:hypothetical protein
VVRDIVELVCEEFNRLHGSEGQVRVIEWLGDRFVAEFVGSFCVTCGFYDYFEDFALMLAGRGVRVGIVSVEEFEGGARVVYRFLGEGEEQRFVPERVVLIYE